MINHITVTFEGDHVLVLSDGDKDYEFLEQLWSQVSRACEKHQCFNILGVANTNTPIEAVEAYELPRIFRENNIDNRYRIAWVERNPKAREMRRFIEAVREDRGEANGHVFPNVADAKAWLVQHGRSRSNRVG